MLLYCNITVSKDCLFFLLACLIAHSKGFHKVDPQQYFLNKQMNKTEP